MELSKREIFVLMLLVAIGDAIFCGVIFVGWQRQNNLENTAKHRTVSLSEEIEIDTENVDDFVSNVTAISVEESEWTRVDLSGDFSKNQNLALKNLLCKQILGAHSIEDNLNYTFKADGTFSGFFDSIEPEVEGYCYEIITQSGDAVLNIYNSDKTMVVTYEISITNTGQIILYYPANQYKIIL